MKGKGETRKLDKSSAVVSVGYPLEMMRMGKAGDIEKIVLIEGEWEGQKESVAGVYVLSDVTQKRVEYFSQIPSNGIRLSTQMTVGVLFAGYCWMRCFWRQEGLFWENMQKSQCMPLFA